MGSRWKSPAGESEAALQLGHDEIRVVGAYVHVPRHAPREACDGVAHLELELPAAWTPQTVWKIALAEGLQIRYLAAATVTLEEAFEKAVERPRGEAR